MTTPHDTWRPLFHLHFQRARPHLLRFATFSLVATALFTLNDRGGIDQFLQYAAVASATLPLLPTAVITKYRHDGFLRFLGTLPVPATQHAASFFALCAVHALPFALLLPFSLTRPPVLLPAAFAPGLALSLLVTTTACTAFLLARQLRSQPGEAASGFVIAVVAIVAVLMAISWLFKQAPGLTTFRLSLPALLVVASIVSLATTLALIRYAWTAIGETVAFGWASDVPPT